jgi:GNAT superfamily N-acetyltransferase
MATTEITLAKTPGEIMLCWEAMHALRPHLVKERFADTVTEMMASGYHLAYIEEDGRAAAAIGYRFLHHLLHGKHIYIDDLTTLPGSRRKGYGGILLDHVFRLAAREGLEFVTLDSGPQRHDAHRLYLNKGFTISSYHFTRPVPGPAR